MPAFDAYSLLDFSARSSPSPVRPSADACWLGTLSSRQHFAATYFRTRAAAMAGWSAWVSRQIDAGHRVLAGFDFALGYPQGFAAAANLPPSSPPWQAAWRFLAERIDDDDRNRNNRFRVASHINQQIAGNSTSNAPGPFWGGTPTRLADCPHLTTRRAFDWPCLAGNGTALHRLRRTDRRAPNAQELWKLAGIGSVGSQSLLGIAALARLLGFADPAAADWAPLARIWPFQTGFALPPETRDARPAVVLAEAFPSLLGEAVEQRMEQHGRIRDAAQVHAGCHWARQRDAQGRLAPCFAPPAGLSPDDLANCIREEGWILGSP